MERRRKFRRQQLTLTQQRYFMSLAFPQFHAEQRGNALTWTGQLRPSPLSNTYTVEVTYIPPLRPKIRILSPELRLRKEAKGLPHVFREGLLCVHIGSDWHPGRTIAQWVMPWLSGWLYFYEAWYLTGFWEGGGTHPERLEHRANSSM